MDWNKADYEIEFYNWCEKQNFEISDEDKETLKPMIEQACERTIPTIELFEIVKSSAS